MLIVVECQSSAWASWTAKVVREEGSWRIQARRFDYLSKFDPELFPIDSSDHVNHDPARDAASHEARSGITERDLSDGEVEALERALSEFSIRPGPPFAMGLDGTTWHVRIENGWNGFELRWWSNLPDEWRSAQPLLDLIASLAEIPPDFVQGP